MYDEAWSSSEVYFISGSEIYEDGAAFSDTVKLISVPSRSKIKIFVSTFVGFIPIIGFLSYIGSYLNDILDLKKIKFDNLISMEFLLILFILIFLLLLRIYLKKN